MSTTGYLSWTPPTWISSLIVAGTKLDKGVVPSWETAGGGVAVEHADGRFVWAFSPDHTNQPLHSGLTSLAISHDALRTIDDNRLFKSLGPRATLAPLEVWIQDEVVDAWEIPATARTTWTMTHGFGYATAAAASPSVPYVAPTVRIEELDGTVLVTMTVVNPPSTPTGTEVLVDDAGDGDTLTTADLSGTYAGKLLVCFYQPLLRCRLDPWSQERSVANVISGSLTFAVTPLKKNWSNG